MTPSGPWSNLTVLMAMVLAAATATAQHAARALSPTKPRPGVASDLVRGADISWPNCPKGLGIPSRRTQGQPLPRPDARFVVIGMTNGPGFTPNPCLTDQITYARSAKLAIAVYAISTYPTKRQLSQYGTNGPWRGKDQASRLRNTGYNQARYVVAELHAQRLAVPMVWVDVEPYSVAPWSHSWQRNRSVITGVLRGYLDARLGTGIYTYANGWQQVTAGWRLPTQPAWSTVGHRGAAVAARSCTTGPSGGPVWLAQWYDTRRDYDLICRNAPDAARLFTR